MKISRKKSVLIGLMSVAALVFSFMPMFLANADDSSTSVDVGSTAPSFTVAPAENPASDGTTPTNVGSTITFQATATDANADDYYLAICKTNSVTPGSSSAPTCGGGNWCISTATDTGVQATCNYQTVAGAESNVWYAFVCDGGTCSSSNQGSGSSGSPFKVNNQSYFDGGGALGTYSDGALTTPDTTFDPGSTIYFAAKNLIDDDVDPGPDTFKLWVCSTDSATSAGCAATTICSSSFAGLNASCNITLASVLEDATVNWYAFVYDNHGFEIQRDGADYYNSGAGTLDRSLSYSINNVTPTVTSVTLNSGSDITLTESADTNVIMTATVTDQNSCQDFNISNIKANLYRSAVSFASCDTSGESNNNSCYADITCTISGNTCVDATDSSVSVTCTVAVKHYADPTTTSTQYPSENWVATVDLTDAGANTGNANATAVELNSLIALNATNTISYGSLAAGANTGATNQSVVVSATGNVGLDTELSGTDMEFSTYTIPVGNQEFSTSTFTYGGGTDLTSSASEVELNVQKTTTETPATKTLYWGIGLPAIVGAGTYTGTNTLTAILGETAGW